jgi:hypothetical protein
MLVHIHPSLQGFACKTRPLFHGFVTPGSGSRTIQGPPRAQSPFARLILLQSPLLLGSIGKKGKGYLCLRARLGIKGGAGSRRMR